MFMNAYLKNETPGIKKVFQRAGVQYDQNDLNAALAGSYNLGGPANQQVILSSIVNGKFDRQLYYQNYYNNLNPGDQSQSNVNRVRMAGGDIATSIQYQPSSPKLSAIIAQPQDAIYTSDNSYLQNYANTGAATELPSLIIDKNLGNIPWYDDNDLVVGNKDLKLIDTPCWFEVNLKQKSSDRLTYNNVPIKIVLNVSLQDIQVSMAHVMNNRHSRTGFHVTLWGQEPDTISATGTTGVFMNYFGITNMMSLDGKASKSQYYNAIIDMFANKDGAVDILKIINNENSPLRVAAQDAFIELLSLFKNNGVTRFQPDIVNRIFPKNKSGAGSTVIGEASRTSPKSSINPWSPAIGMSLAQATNRSNDVMTRGYVVFRYKNKSYLGYFKDIQFEMDANNPFRWNFNFTFQVEKSLLVTYFLNDSKG
jgi:hypothetical protein